MPKYVFAYHGGGMPESEEEQAATNAAWGVWMGANAASFADPGAPTAMAKTVSSSGSTDGGGANPITGYTIVNAADIDAACEIAASCPIIASGGSVEVAETFEIDF